MILRRSDIYFLYELEVELFRQKYRTLSPRKKRELHEKAFRLRAINNRLEYLCNHESAEVNK